MFFRSFILVFLLVLPQFFSGQQLQFDNLEAKISLPSQECYNIMQDSKGYVWFATEQGLCRYNGQNITVFDGSNGLPERSVFAMVEDRKGRLWMATSKNRIMVYEKGKLKEASFSAAYASKIPGKITRLLTLEPSGKLYMVSESDTFMADLHTGKMVAIHNKTSDYDQTLLESSGKMIVTNFRKSIKENDTKPGSYSVQFVDAKGLKASITVSRIKSNLPQVFTYDAPGRRFCTVTDKLLEWVSGKAIIHKFPRRILSFYADKDGGFWIGVMKEGLFYYKDGNLNQLPIRSLRGYSVTGILEDSENNIWCTTLEKGVFRSKSKWFVNFSNIDGLSKPVDFLKCIEGNNYCSYEGKEILRIPSFDLTCIPFGNFNSEEMCDLLKTDTGWLIGGKQFSARTDKDFKNVIHLQNAKSKSYSGVTSFFRIDGKIFALCYTEFMELKGNQLISRSTLKTKARHIVYDNHRFLYGEKGLYWLDSLTWTATKVKGVDDAVTGIIKAKPGKFWIATKGGGLFCLEKNKLSRLDLPARVLYDIKAHGNNLWIASNKGLIRVSFLGSQPKAVIYNTKEGLPSDVVYKLAIDGKQLFLSTLEGVCVFPLSQELKNAIPPRIYLTTAWINDRQWSNPKQKKTLDFDQNSFRFVFDVLAFKTEPVLYYQVNDKAFKKSNGHELLFENLPSGSYKLTVYALNSSGIKSAKPIVISFEIGKPFWLQWWFLAVCAAFVGLGIYFVIRKNAQKIKAKETEKTRINKLVAESQLSALQAQMNPHFIFNAINSIQNYILKNQEKEAYDYLAKFSKLIRMVLYNSQQQQLSLQEELETIGLYIELEQLRFGESFDFVLEVSEEVDEFETVIPTMIIQPYLENAIWHGLMNLEGERRGKIILSISNDNGLLRIVITDNGIGRKLASAYKRENTHQAVGMKLTQQRVEIINQSHGHGEINVTVDDLYNANGNPEGTRVIITLPLNAE